MIDIKLETETINFTYRVAAIIFYKSKVLMQRNSFFDYITLPGGKCTLGETSSEAVIREIKEETGMNCKYIKTRAVIENMFHSDFDNRNRHELLFICELKIIDESDISDKIIFNLESKYESKQYFEWIELKKLKKYNVKPNFLQNIINNDQLSFIVNKD